VAIITRKNRKKPYIVKVRDSIGNWFPQLSFSSKAEAKAYERECEVQRDKKVNVIPTEVRTLTLTQYWEKWSKECRFRVSEGWRKSQNQMWRDYICPHLGMKKLTEITSRDIGFLLEKVSKIRQPGTVVHVYNILHKMFFDACDYFEFIDKNPVKRKFRPIIPEKERDFLEPEQVWDLLFASENHYLGPAIWIMSLTGLRAGEVNALKWNAIDFNRNQVLIKATWNKRIRQMQDYPKGKRWGRVPMPEPLVDYLKPLSKGKKSDDLVCTSATGGFLHHENILKHLKIQCKKANVPVITPHELRHSATELYFNESASVEDVRRL